MTRDRIRAVAWDAVERNKRKEQAVDFDPKAPLTETANVAQRKAVFPISGGEVAITFPAVMSDDEMDDLEAYLEVFFRCRRKKK